MSTSGQIMFPFNVASGVPIDSRLVVGPTHYYTSKESIVNTYPGLKTYVDNSGDPENGKTYMWDGSNWVLDTGGGIASGITSGITKGFVPAFESDDVIVRSAIRMGNDPADKNVFIDGQGGTEIGFNDSELTGENNSLFVLGKIKTQGGFIGNGAGIEGMDIASTTGNLPLNRIPSAPTIGGSFLRSNGGSTTPTWQLISSLPVPTLQQVTNAGSSTINIVRFTNKILIGPDGNMDYDIERHATYGFSISRAGGARIFGLEPVTVDGNAQQSVVIEGASGHKVRFLTSHMTNGVTNRRLAVPGNGIINGNTYHEVLSVNGRFVRSDDPNNMNGNIRLPITNGRYLTMSSPDPTTLIKDAHINYNLIENTGGVYPENTEFGFLNMTSTAPIEPLTDINRYRIVIVSNLTSLQHKVKGEFFILAQSVSEVILKPLTTYEFSQVEGGRWRLMGIKNVSINRDYEYTP